MRFRLTVTQTREYDVDPADYPSGMSVEDMLLADHDTIVDDPDVMLDHPDTREEVRVELVEEKGTQ